MRPSSNERSPLTAARPNLGGQPKLQLQRGGGTPPVPRSAITTFGSEAGTVSA